MNEGEKGGKERKVVSVCLRVMTDWMCGVRVCACMSVMSDCISLSLVTLARLASAL